MTNNTGVIGGGLTLSKMNVYLEVKNLIVKHCRVKNKCGKL